MEISDFQKNEIYSFVYSKRDKTLSSVTSYALRLQFRSKYSEDELDDILDLLVKSGDVKTNGTRTDQMRSFWVRRDPDRHTPEEDRGGFLKARSPGHALKLLNSYMRSDLLKCIHENVYKYKDAHPRQSPLSHITKAINDVLDSWGDTKLFECFSVNPYHINPNIEFHAEEDFDHDIKLMKFHLKALKKTLNRIKEDEIFL